MDPLAHPARRLALEAHDLLQSEPSPAFDDLAALAARVTDASLAAVCVVGPGPGVAIWSLATATGPVSRTTIATVDECLHRLVAGDTLVVQDTLLPEPVPTPVLRGAPPVRAYAAIPLRSAGGLVLGAIAVFDPVPRAFRDDQLTELARVGRLTESQLTLRRHARDLPRALQQERHAVQDAARARRDLAAQATERDRLETGLVRAQRLEGMGVVASGLAHDINNVLGPILIASHTLRPYVRDAEGQELVDLIEDSARLGADLVQQLLPIARERPATCDLGEVVRRTIRWVDDAHGFRRRIAVEVDALPAVPIDPTQLQQVLLNVLVNARDALGDDRDGRVVVRGWATPEDVRLSVTDDGPGMPPAVLQRATEPLFTTKPEGTGLGLATSRAIARRHGGKLELDSTVGRGTVVTLVLPRAVRG